MKRLLALIALMPAVAAADYGCIPGGTLTIGTVNLSTLANNTYLAGRNAANSADISILKVDGTDDTTLNADTGDSIKFTENNTLRWSVAPTTGDLLQDSTNGGNLYLSKAASTAASGIASVPSDVSTPKWLAFDTTGLPVFTGVRGSVDTAGPIVRLAKSRQTNGTADTVVASGDTLGNYTFQGADGASFITAASIAAAVDGTPGTNDLPGRLEFYTTPDGSNALLRRWLIEQDGDLVQDGTNGGNVIFSKSTFNLTGNTSDGADNQTLNLNGGGGIVAGRGAGIIAQGEQAGGNIDLFTSTTAGNLNLSSAAGELKAFTGGSERWAVQQDGDLAQNATNGGNVVYAKAGTGTVDAVGTLAALGNSQGTAAALVSWVTTVTAADGTKGVIFPATPVTNSQWVVYNTGAAALSVYPGTGDQINAAGANTAVSVAAYGSLYCHATSASQWWCGEMANP